MSSNVPVSLPPVPDSPPASTVRRHHTITATSRAARAGARVASEEAEEHYNDDEVVDQDWVGGVGAVGEKNANLHRQASLPTRYNRPFPRSSQNRQAGNLTPRTINSLTAIAAEHGHEGEEEEWERDIKGLRNDEDEIVNGPDVYPQYQQVIDAQSQGSSHSPLSPAFPPNVPSPPPAASNIRRHQSLTYGAAGGNVKRVGGASGLRRAGTLQAQVERHGHGHPGGGQPSPSPPTNDGHLAEEEVYEEDEYLPNPYAQQSQVQQGHYTPNSVGRGSPWGSSGSIDWKYSGGDNGNGIDDIQRALSNLELAASNAAGYTNQSQPLRSPGFPPSTPSQSALPPRLTQQGGVGMNNSPAVNNGQFNNGTRNVGMNATMQQNRLQFDDNDYAAHQQQQQQQQQLAMAPIGHKTSQQGLRHQRTGSGGQSLREEGTRSALSPNGSWDQRDRGLSPRTSNQNMRYSGGYDSSDLPPNPPLPAQYLNQNQQALRRQNAITNSAQGVQGQNAPFNNFGSAQQQFSQPPQVQEFLTSPVDVPTLIATKGYNPASFDTKPVFARFFVIKSYTEDDVHKSLKYEIWSSTDPGNKRLDKAFKDVGGRGPIYLFFSVNASGHFCGVAEMLTSVDYSRSSTVWASDKWKGVFKVRWIFVRDIPNSSLRHIKLLNTQEQKPVTNSRDTQELLPEAGQEMLRIFFSHPAKTSLLQDFAFYELQALQKAQQQTSPPPTSASPQPQLSPQGIQQHPYAMPNPYAGQPLPMNPSLSPMMQMQMQIGNQYSHPQAIQSMMRGPSPVPLSAGQAYLGANSGF